MNGHLPEEQHGFRKGRSTESAIKLLNQHIQYTLATPKNSLYVIFVDFRKAFDSVDRSLLLQKLSDMGLSHNFISVLYSFLEYNYVQVISNNYAGEIITQNKGLPQGECFSPHLFSLFIGDLPNYLNTGDTKTVMYADDLAIICSNVSSAQNSLDKLNDYCTLNKLEVNISKTKVVKFRRGGRFSLSDSLLYNGTPIEFTPSFVYLGVLFQTTGSINGHLSSLQKKGIASCAKVSQSLPLGQVSLETMGKLFHSVVFPSATYGLRAIKDQLSPNSLSYITLVQARMIKMWFGVSKYASSSRLLAAVGWADCADLGREVFLGSGTTGEYMPSCVDKFTMIKGDTRRVVGQWFSNGLHNQWCSIESCFKVGEMCRCRLCGCAGVEEKHLTECSWVGDYLLKENQMMYHNLPKLSKMLYVI